MAQETYIQELISDAILVQTYGQRTGVFKDSALADAIAKVQSVETDWNNPGIVPLAKALNDSIKVIEPVTLLDLRKWDPFNAGPAGKSRKSASWKYAYVAFAMVLIMVSGHFTAWQKRATKLMDETMQMAELTRSTLIDDLVLLFFDGGSDAADPAGFASVPMREMVSQLRLIEEKVKKNFQQNVEHDARFIPLQTTYWRAKLAYEQWRAGGAATTGGDVIQASIFVSPTQPKAGVPGTASDSWATTYVTDCRQLRDFNLVETKVGVAALEYNIRKIDNISQRIRCFIGVDNVNAAQYIRARWIETLGNRIDLLSSWILPALYGALGAVMYFMRDFLNSLRPDPGIIEVAVRVALGVFAGVSVGWFAAPTTLIQGIGIADVSLATLSLAFLVGFGIDVFFRLLDRMLELFRGSVARLGGDDDSKPPKSGPTATSAG